MANEGEEVAVLLVCANPHGTDSLRTGEEDRVLREAIRLSEHRKRFKIETLNAATIDDVRRALLRKIYTIVHFSGHGTGEGLVLEDHNGRPQVPDSGALADLLSSRGVTTALYNACYSLSAGSLTAGQLKYSIATTGPIADPAAIEFTRGFYDGIGAGLDVPEAFGEGVSCARLKRLNPPLVFLRQGETHTPNSNLETERNRSWGSGKLLLGVLVDVSGSMEQSIRNDSRGGLSRLEAANDSIAKLGQSIQSEIESVRAELRFEQSFRIFAYAFGLRTGGVADLFSLWSAAQDTDIENEIEKRKRSYEASAKRQANQYSGLASLARNHGFGSAVDSVTSGMRNSAVREIRQRIANEISSLLLERARALGDSTLTAYDLAALLKSDDDSLSLEDMEPLIYGGTPLCEAVEITQTRFDRTTATGDDEQRTLLVISDGEPTDGDPRDQISRLRKAGVNVLCCFVTDEDIATPRVLPATMDQSWSQGARLMFEMASRVDEDSPFFHELVSLGWDIQTQSKLFIQVNHTDVMDEFVRASGAHLSGSKDACLPKGR